VSVEVVGLGDGDGEAVGGLEAFGGSGVASVDSIVVVLIVVIVVVAETPFTRGR
jgi:hypothetical protein